MKTYSKYVCAVLMVLGVSVNAWGADPSAPSANYTLIKSVGSLSTNDRVILYDPTGGVAISGLSTCNSSTEARVSSSTQEWVEYKVTVVDASTIKLQDTRISSNNYVYNNSNKFQYAGSSSATALSITSAGIINAGGTNLNAKTVGTGTCERASARFASGGNPMYVFKVASPKESKYTVSTASAELSITIDDDAGEDGYYYTSSKLVTVTTTAAFEGEIDVEFTGFTTSNITNDFISVVNSNNSSGGFVISKASDNEGVYVRSWSLGWDNLTNGTFHGYIHVYPETGTNTTDEFYIPITITIVNGNDGCVEHDVVYGHDGSGSDPSDDSECASETVSFTPSPSTGHKYNGATIYEDDMETQITTLDANTTSFSMYNRDVYVVVHYAVQSYTVNLDRNGGTTGATSITTTYNSSTITGWSAPSRTGYTFGGYYDAETSNNGSGNLVISTSGVLQAGVTGYTGAGGIWTKTSTPTTLYANWTVNSHTLAVSAVDNIVISSSTPSVAEGSNTSVDYGTTVTLSHGDPDAGYVWGGWNVYKTGDANTTVTVNGSNQFTMPNYGVTVSANLYGDLKAWCETKLGVYDQAGTGDADIHLTSTYNVSVFTTYEIGNLITIIAENLDGIANLGGGTANKQNIQIKYLDANNSDAEVDKTKSPFRLCYYNEEGKTNYNVADGSNINLNGLVDYSQTYAISYTPKDYGVTDHYKLQLRLQNNNTEAKTITFDLYGRSLPREFVIAAKYVDPGDDTNNGKWFALPNTIVNNSTNITPTEITVDNATTPTKAIGSPSTVLYRAMDRNASGTNRYAISFTDDDTPVYGSRNKLKISKNNNYVYLSSTGSAKYQDWYLESSDFGAYTVTMPTDDSDPSGKKMGLWSYSGVKMGYYKDPPKAATIYFLPVDYGEVEADIMEWGTDHLVMDLRDPGDADYVKTQIAVGDLGSKQTLSDIKKDYGVYYLSQTLSSSNAGQDLKLYFYDDDDALVGVVRFTIPVLVSASDATTSGISGATAGLCDVVILNGGVLTVSETTAGSKKNFRDLYIYGGGKMVVPNDRFIEFSNVYMRGGHLNSSWVYQYSHPQLVLNGTMGNASNTINYDYLTNNAQFYSLALPYDVTLSGIVNPYFNNKQSWLIHGYDGALRASGSIVSGWYDVEEGSDGEGSGDIDPLGPSDALTAGIGYTFFGAPQKVGGNRQRWSINRFPMTLASGTAEAAKSGVDVFAYGMTETPAESGTYVLDDGVTANNAGWNMVGNPYLADVGGDEDLEEEMEAIITSKHRVEDENGGWHLDDNAEGVRYVRIPNDQGTEYSQIRFKDATLKAFRHFFIQAEADGKFSIALNYRKQSAPARRHTNGAVLPNEMDIDMILRKGEDKTSFGLTVNDAFTPDFKVGEDMPEDLSGTIMKAYTFAGSNRLTYNGLPYNAAENVIPVGYRAQTAGTYAFSYKENRYSDYVAHVWLIDYTLSETVDLLEGAYEFTSEAGVYEDRFAIHVVFNTQNAPTDMSGTESYSDKPVKFIYHDNMYIMRGGVIYDATGKRVNEIK